MKKHILTILLLVSVGIVFGLYATSDLPNIIEKVSVAMSKGESAEIAKYLNPTVEVEILGQDNIYSKAQTELMLKDFFAKNKPKSLRYRLMMFAAPGAFRPVQRASGAHRA